MVVVLQAFAVVDIGDSVMVKGSKERGNIFRLTACYHSPRQGRKPSTTAQELLQGQHLGASDLLSGSLVYDTISLLSSPFESYRWKKPLSVI